MIRTSSNAPRRILIAAHSAEQGGAELCLDTLLAILPPGKYDLTAVFPWDGPMAERARARGARVETCPMHWWMCWGYSRWYLKTLLAGSLPSVARLVRTIRRNQVELVYSNSAVLFEPAVAARLVGVPHVWHVHELLRPGNVTAPALPLAVIRRLIGGLSDRILFESEAGRRAFLASGTGSKCRVVPNCVRFPTDLDHPDREAARARLGLGTDDRVVAFIGRLSERKDPLLLVRALARLPDRKGLRCLFVGDGPLRDRLADEIRTRGLTECCQLLPFREDVGDVFGATDVLVLPSRQESFGLVLVEAAAWGKPVIATRSGGPEEIVVDGVTGFLVPPADEQALARRLAEVFGQGVDRERMGREAARRVREHFSAAAHARAVEDVWESVLAGASRRGERRVPQRCLQPC
jgi:glycosyltransferase involved in cell wall biosynthesis